MVVVKCQRMRVVIPQGAFSQSAPLTLQFVVQPRQALSVMLSGGVENFSVRLTIIAH